MVSYQSTFLYPTIQPFDGEDKQPKTFTTEATEITEKRIS